MNPTFLHPGWCPFPGNRVSAGLAFLYLPLFFLVLLFLLPPGRASGSEELTGAKAIAMGGAFRAMADDNSAIFYNPAGITQEKKYHLVSSYAYQDPCGASFIGSSIADSKTSAIGAGTAYVYRNYFQNQEGQWVERHDHHLAMSVAQQYLKTFHVGFTTHYLWRGEYLETREGIETEKDAENGWMIDAAVLLNPHPFINLGVVGKNLKNIEGYQRELNFGFASRIANVLNLAFDLVWLPGEEEDNIGYHVGGEIVARQEVGLRGGYAFDRADRDWYGLGAAWYIPRGSFSYTFRREVGDSEQKMHWIEIGVTI